MTTDTPVPDRLSDEEIAELTDVVASLTPTPQPWCRDYLYTAIRHCDRNEDFGECDEGADHVNGECFRPNRYDGPAIAKLRNAAPRLLATLLSLRSQVDQLTRERDAARNAKSALHRRAQKAEAEVIRLTKQLEAKKLDTWASPVFWITEGCPLHSSGASRSTGERT